MHHDRILERLEARRLLSGDTFTPTSSRDLYPHADEPIVEVGLPVEQVPLLRDFLADADAPLRREMLPDDGTPLESGESRHVPGEFIVSLPIRSGHVDEWGEVMRFTTRFVFQDVPTDYHADNAAVLADAGIRFGGYLGVDSTFVIHAPAEMPAEAVVRAVAEAFPYAEDLSRNVVFNPGWLPMPEPTEYEPVAVAGDAGATPPPAPGGLFGETRLSGATSLLEVVDDDE